VKSVHPIAIADHLWDLFGRMAEEMGGEREALINQAMHVFARLHGFAAPVDPAAARPPPFDSPERRAAVERVLDTAARLEEAIQGRDGPPPIPTEPAPPAGDRDLVLVREDGSEVPVSKDRFIIGRGKHCDLIVESSKVSREHAAIFREEGGWIIEDLSSANGTWYCRAKVQRRRIEDGDEYFVCAERIRCVLR
jgi:hypothetical protein